MTSSGTARLGLAVNFIYASLFAAVGVLMRSWWYTALAAYYVVLSVMRFAVLRFANRPGGENDPFVSRFTGVSLMILSIPLAGLAYLSVAEERAMKHHEIVMICAALYSFSKVTLAIIGFVRLKQHHTLALKTLRNISLATAAVSVSSLQRSMLVSFEGMSEENICLMNGLTGTAVYLLVFILGVNLFGGKRVNMAKSKLVQVNQKIAEGVVDGYKKIEDGVVSGYKKIESGVVEGYTKLEDRFIDQFLTREGETVEEAKARLKNKPE